jgi:hypothetical protein
MNERRFAWNSQDRAAFICKAALASFATLSRRVKAMAMILGKSIRAFLVRSLAVVAVVLTYAFGNVGTQVLSVAGISALGVTATATPANAWRRYRRRRLFVYLPYRRRRRRFRRWW